MAYSTHSLATPFQKSFPSSKSSLNLLSLIPPDSLNPSLLSESLTLASLSSTSQAAVPLSFPAGCMVPMFSILPLGSPSPMFPNGLQPLDRIDIEEQEIGVTISVPTSPRLKAVLTENLCIEQWVANLELMEAPGHTPWVGDQQFLPVHEVEHSTLSAPRHSASRRVQPQSFRDALVFEREITLKTDGKTKRWSLHVPATTMKPEMVDMMLELQGLNSFFKEGLEDLDNSVATLCQEKEKLDLPSLTISNSHSTVPLLLLGVTEDATLEPPLSLAARRGKRCLPALSVNQTPGEIMYPGFPTAFLGSPSSYSPKFEFANNTGDSPLDLQDMIANLRSQTAYISSPPPSLAEEPPMAPRIPSASTLSTAFLPEKESMDDEWGFASSRLADHRGQPSTDAIWTINSIAEPQPKSDTGKSSTNYEIFQGPLDKAYDPPSSPLPTQPATPLGGSRVRSILKPHKSVRFASLPNHKQAEVSIAPSMALPQSSRHSTGSPKKSPARSPSPLRNSFTASSRDTARSTPMQRAHIATQSLQQFATTTVTSLPTQRSNNLQAKAALPPQNAGVSPKISPLQRPTGKASSLSRHSLGRAMIMGTPRGKENKHESLPSRSPDVPNKNHIRREVGQESPIAVQRSKMPVPLRNIFTRFK